ncbi:MAG: nitroreductase family protein [candidate division WOR-3 bacterium]|jgi:nitroreductase|nr:nitroreductase family protein [candidate division WOR-3 bacterium]MCR4424217.1 nitroreductase family protein [candidate division WOR-3 bacterium]MDH7519365.1 nitroreductase family protein [bacterium]
MDERIMPIFMRRSVREYSDTPVDERDVLALLEAGMAAPSARNLKPWHFILIKDRDILQRIADIHPAAQMLNHAALAIAVCGDRDVSPHFWVQDCSAATENILIAAAMLGLGAVWLGVHPREERERALKALLGIPEKFGLLCVIAVGVPKAKPEPRTQFDPSRIHQERW